MPIFEYTCGACGERFEKLVLPGKEPPKGCPACESTDVERVFSLPAVQTDDTRGRAVKSAHRRRAVHARERVEEQRRYEEAHEGH